ncbi:MAG: RNA-binding protein [Bacteroidetes bacterium]|nr:RNA-binding protein [Bacteroidota bacterium]MBS1608857.1 RNA-binding protein [Bacteroidota bacterium]
MKILISNFGFNMQDEDLRDFFMPYGKVSSARVIIDKLTGKARGFGYVIMQDVKAARKAIEELNELIIEGNKINVAEAEKSNKLRYTLQ